MRTVLPIKAREFLLLHYNITAFLPSSSRKLACRPLVRPARMTFCVRFNELSWLPRPINCLSIYGKTLDNAKKLNLEILQFPTYGNFNLNIPNRARELKYFL